MTEENYQYRTSQNMLRNQFEGEGTFQIPIIPKASFIDEDFRELLLIGFDRARPDDKKNSRRMKNILPENCLCRKTVVLLSKGAV